MTEMEMAGNSPQTPAENNYSKNTLGLCRDKVIGARVINRDIFSKLDPLEQVIGQKFINEGKWVISE